MESMHWTTVFSYKFDSFTHFSPFTQFDEMECFVQRNSELNVLKYKQPSSGITAIKRIESIARAIDINLARVRASLSIPCQLKIFALHNIPTKPSE